MKNRLHVVGNSHLWTLFGWDRWAARDSSIMFVEEPERDLEMVGFAVTGVTAHNLIESDSQTGGGERAVGFLNADVTPDKDVLVVYGEVDCVSHIVRYVPDVDAAIDLTMDRYAQFLRSITGRQDVRRLLVASTTPHCKPYQNTMAETVRDISLRWNERLRTVCSDNGWEYVDFYDRFVDDEGFCRSVEDSPSQNHMHPQYRDGMLDAVAGALRRR